MAETCYHFECFILWKLYGACALYKIYLMLLLSWSSKWRQKRKVLPSRVQSQDISQGSPIALLNSLYRFLDKMLKKQCGGVYICGYRIVFLMPIHSSGVTFSCMLSTSYFSVSNSSILLTTMVKEGIRWLWMQYRVLNSYKNKTQRLSSSFPPNVSLHRIMYVYSFPSCKRR